MRILFCHNDYAREGGENTVSRDEVRILRDHGHEVVEYRRDSRETERYGALAKARAWVEGLYSWRTRREVGRLVRQLRPEVAIVQNVFPLISPSVYDALRAGGVPIVQLVFNYRLVCPNAQLFVEGAVCERCLGGHTLHAAAHRCMRGDLAISVWYALILGLHRARRTMLRAIDRYVVPHPFVGRKLVEGGVPPERVRVNANPFVVPAAPAESEAEPPYVLFVGRVVVEKGVLTLVQALEQVPPPLRLVVVGDGEALPDVRAYLAARPELAARVDLAGARWGEELQALYRGALAFVLPARWYDPSPLLLYNALALGKPAVATSLGSQPEIVEDGVNGFIVPPGDPAALADRLGRLASDPALRRRLGAAGRAKAEALLGAETHYRGLCAVLDELAPGAA